MLKGEWRGEDSNGAVAGPIAAAVSLNIPLASAPSNGLAGFFGTWAVAGN